METSNAGTQLRVIHPGDEQYDQWNNRAANLAFIGRPSSIIPVSSENELIAALQATVDKKQHLAIRGGGHCMEDFVGNPDVQVIIDISQMKGIRYDAEMNAIEIKAGNTLGEVQQKLSTEWNIFLPSGEHPAVGIGGHIQGGAFGFFCRQHGLGADYLYAVEIIYINEQGKVEKAFATRDNNDANRELWWAHTGGGAGNFGVVTRFWFRSPITSSKDPRQLLPAVPGFVETADLEWAWKDLEKKGFQQLLENFCDWCSKHSHSNDAGSLLHATIFLWNRQLGKIQMKVLVTEPNGGMEALDSFIKSLNRQLDIPFKLGRKKQSFLEFALHPFPDIFTDHKAAFKAKDAFFIKPITKEQIETIYKHLGNPDTPGGGVAFATYGGKVNDVAPDQTASAQRRAILTSACMTGWMDAAEKDKYLDWGRKCYAEIHQHTGGVPVPGDTTGGCIIAHPDKDMADPKWNKSGVPWYTFYYQDNYPRLQKVKAKWDPLNIFHHSLSVKGK